MNTQDRLDIAETIARESHIIVRGEGDDVEVDSKGFMLTGDGRTVTGSGDTTH